MNNQTACFTGHRIIARADLPIITKRLDDIIAELIGKGIVYYGSGMARGFDLLAAQAVIKAQQSNTYIKLIAVLPCREQEIRWTDSEKQEYKRLLATADKAVYVSDVPYYDGCMAKRNLHLVTHSSVCVAYMNHERSGTAQTVRLARERGLRVINLADIR